MLKVRKSLVYEATADGRAQAICPVMFQRKLTPGGLESLEGIGRWVVNNVQFLGSEVGEQ